jgi:O-Antigen ligase
VNAQSDAGLTTRAKIAGTFALGFGFFAMVGVTGLSLVIGLVGLWALVWGLTSAKRPLLAAFSQGIAKNWLAWLSFGAFVVWVMASATWSPAPELAAQSVRRLACMGILAPLAIWASASTSEADQVTLRRAIIAALGMALVFLSFETLSGAAANKLASPEKDPLAIAGDLGRAATATLCLTWIGFACIKRSNFGPRLLFGLVIFSGFVALQFGTDLNAVGLVLGTCAALLALTFPRVAIGILSGISALIVISAPELYPFLTKIAVAIAPGGHLPMSYGRRAQMWNLAADLIAQKPLTGWGLGAGSTFDKVVRFEGFDWPQIQLHPHSAPLHIWLETGAVGAILASIAIIAAGGAAISTFGRHKVAASVLVGGLTFLALQWGMSHAAWREWMWTCFAMIIAGALALRDFAPKRSVFEDDPV